MELDFEQREVRLGIGELATFSLTPRFGGEAPTGRWRTRLGREWHQRLQADSRDAASARPTEALRAEVALEARWPVEGWTALLRGRIDEVRSRAEVHCLREIKTVRLPLPADPGELRARFPAYFAQLSLYVELARHHPEWNDRAVEGELLLVDIDEGDTQLVALDEGEAAFRLSRQVDALGHFLRLRGESYDARRELPAAPPFDTWREGQAEVPAQLAAARRQAPVVLFEAPTGFGKTAFALAHGLDALREGRVGRLVYLTGKSSGQGPILDQLGRLLGDTPGLRFLQMRNRSELALEGSDPGLFDRGAMAQRWREAGLQLEDLFVGPTATPAHLRETGQRHGLDPHALARALLPLCDLWIGDYNYLFSPGSAGVFRDVAGFDPRQTLLIVDEAHNLASRVAGAWSNRFQAADWHVLTGELARLDWPRECVRTAEEFADFLDSLRPSDALEPVTDLEGRSLVRRLAQLVSETPLPWEEAPPFAADLLWSLPAALAAIENRLLPLLSWCPAPGRWDLTCLDASAEIGPALGQFGQALLMSATLQPLDECAGRLGLPCPGTSEAIGNVTFLEGEAPWRATAHRVAIDVRVNTRYRHRERSLRRTAHTVLQLSDGQPAPVAVFFSSYRYAEDVRRLLEWEAPHLRVAMQPRGLDLPGQEAFLEEALLLSHVLFLILGSSFAEGIDVLGGRIARAMVVGPALPEVNAVQEATREALHASGHPDPFRAIYQVPGMQRIHQALGRLVRAPGHEAAILLQGERFNEPAYRSLLRPEFGSATVIARDEDLAEWLRGRP